MPENTGTVPPAPGGTGSTISVNMAIALAVIAAILAALLGALVSPLLGGDEAPIRVKNTSIELRLLGTEHEWEQQGNKYVVKGDDREKDDYDYYVDGTGCQVNGEKGTRILFTHSDNATVEAQVKNKKTEVTSSGTLTLSADRKALTYSSAGGFIKSITVDGAEKCTFAARADLAGMMMLDY